MKTPPTDFTVEDATALQALLSAPERPEETIGYFETAGFLFAVCCNPDMVGPSEWLPEVLGTDDGIFADLEEANRGLHLLMALYNNINAGVLERRPSLPLLCEVRPAPLDNLEPDAPLSLWSRGFGQGYDWLLESWPDDLPDDMSEDLGACLMVLTFHSNRELAEAYRAETEFKGPTLEAMSTEMQEILLPTMAAYADLGRTPYEGALQ